MNELPAKVRDLGLVRRPLEDDEDAEQFKPLENGQTCHLHIGALLQLHREDGVVVV